MRKCISCGKRLKQLQEVCPKCNKANPVTTTGGSEWDTKYERYREYEDLFGPQHHYESDIGYQTRVVKSAAIFQTLPAVDQKFIIAAAEDGFHWRGDDMDYFRKTYEEYMKYKSLTPYDKIEYRKRAMDYGN